MNVAITGAASGLGRVIAEGFAKAGHRIYVCDVAEAAVASLASAGLAELAMSVDVADRVQLDSWFSEVFAKTSDLDVLINNVGVAGPHALIEEVKPDDWRRTLDANLDAAYHGTQRVLPAMKAQRRGVIINVSTASVLTNPQHRSPYVVSKAALEALTLATAREAGPFNVRCNAIRPGMMNNDRLNRILQRVAERTGTPIEQVEADSLRYVWMRRKVEMTEVADLVLYLTSETARSITGQIIAVDGGMHWEE
jgi:NAD(P)-dependent dehydrogenase (short-subunit alcohol dehydrogenase family)